MTPAKQNNEREQKEQPNCTEGTELVKKTNFKEQLPKIVIAILVVFFIVGLSWGLKSVLEIEGTMEPNVAKASLSPLPESVEAQIGYIASALGKAEKEKPAITFSDAFSIDKDTIRAGDAQTTAEYIRTGIEEKLGEIREDCSADFGEDFSGKLRMPAIASDAVSSAELKYDYWKCPACGRETDEKPQTCEDCGSDEDFLRKYRDEYTITLHLPDTVYPAAADSPFAQLFQPFTAAQIEKLVRAHNGGWFDLKNGFAITYKNIAICAVINRLTDKIASITYSMDCDFSADVSFVGKYAAYKTQNFACTVHENARYNFTWPEISIAAQELVLTPGQTDVLRAESTCCALTDDMVTWSSSDESIASVNHEGYVTAKRKTGQCTVTASFTFMGKQYTAECLIHVKVPAEEIDISHRKLKLAVGDTYTLKATVSPMKATIKTVKWYSDNEEIAVVSQDGTVTAKQSGTVDIYAVSDDGYFKATCHVEVQP